MQIKAKTRFNPKMVQVELLTAHTPICPLAALLRTLPLTNAAMALSRSVCYQRHNVSHITRRAVTMHLAHGLDKVHTSTGGVTFSPGPSATTSWCKCPAPYREKRTQLKWRSHALMRSHISRDRPRDERTQLSVLDDEWRSRARKRSPCSRDRPR